MKKVFLLVILLLPISVFAWDSCNSDKVVIKSITKLDESGYVEENNDPLTDGKIVSTDIKLYDVGDSITYNIKLKNNSDEDYSLDKIFTNSDNVKYEIISDNNKLKALEEKEVQLKITYTKKVDDSMYKSGKYTENKELDMVISNSINNTNSSNSNNNSSIKNPITSSINKIIVIILLIVFLLISGLLIKRDIRNSSLLLLLLLFIPVFVKAECRYVIRINSNIELKKVIPNPCYKDSGGIVVFRKIDSYDNEFDVANSINYDYYYDSLNNGYRMSLKNKNSTEPITERICTSVNGQPIVNMKELFKDSQAVSIDLSSFDTSNVVDMSYMFYGSQTTALDLSSFDTSKVVDMSAMFYGSQATALDLSGFDTSKVTNMTAMFENSQASNINLRGFNTSNVTDMRGMFQDSQATSIDVSNFDTSNVTNMYGMFRDSQSAILDLSSFDTSNVTTMERMFQDSQATTINLSSFDTSNVTTMFLMFSGSQATTLDLSSFNTSNVTRMSDMFDGSQATSIDVSSFDTSNVISMNGMFRNCKVTTPFDLSNFTSESLTDINWMFAYTSMPSLDISGFSLNNAVSRNSTFRDSTINTVYVKSQESLDILRRYDSSNNPMIPSTMNFVVKGN